MVRHIVFLKLQDNSEVNRNFVKDKLLSMKGKIDVLKNIEVGVDFVGSERSYDLALLTDFETKEDLDTYRTHPVHVPIVNYLKETKTDTKVVDFEY